MSDDEAPRGRVFHAKKPINRKTKLHIVFDPEKRKEFLTGFHKRKLQRKKKAQDELQEQLKIERKRLKQEARESFKKLVGTHQPVPSLEDLATQNYELENHSVSIVELSTAELAEKNNWIGPNKVEYEDESPAGTHSEKEEEELPGMAMKTARDVKIALKKRATQEVKKSKAFQLKNKIEQQKNKKKSLQQRKRNQKEHIKKNKRKRGK